MSAGLSSRFPDLAGEGGLVDLEGADLLAVPGHFDQPIWPVCALETRDDTFLACTDADDQVIGIRTGKAIAQVVAASERDDAVAESCGVAVVASRRGSLGQC